MTSISKTITLLVDERELATILAALRFHQDENLQGRDDIPDEPIREIATNGGALKPLSFNEVGELCESINLGEDSDHVGIGPSLSPGSAIRQIHDLLYLDVQDGREFYNPDKNWDADVLSTIADVVAECIPRRGADANQTPAAEIDGNPLEKEPRVIISVSGGVADVMLKPKGVAVSIFDYDVEGEEHSTKDPDGQTCCISESPAPEKVIGNRHWPIVKRSASSIGPARSPKWKCPDCGSIARCSYEQLAEAGCPYCPDCDTEMRMT